MKITRLKLGERISIGDNTTVEVMEINGQQARLIVRAPKHIKILRDDAVKKEKHEA